MPRKSPEAIDNHARYLRNRHRRLTHGEDWRGIVAYFGFMCAKCCSQEGLEIHEPFGELKVQVQIGQNHKMQLRVLLCIDCHMAEHHGRFSRIRGNESRYLEDIDREILECGSYDAWVEKYKVGSLVGANGGEKPMEENARDWLDDHGLREYPISKANLVMLMSNKHRPWRRPFGVEYRPLALGDMAAACRAGRLRFN